MNRTASAIAAGRLLDIELLDHIVVGHTTFVSLRDLGEGGDQPRRSCARGESLAIGQ